MKSVKFVVVLVSVIALAFAFAHANSAEASEISSLVSVKKSSNEKTLTSVSVQPKQRYLVRRVQKLTGTKKYLVFVKNGRSIMTTQRLKKTLMLLYKNTPL